MGIADFFRPKYRHSDVRVRVEAVRALTSDDAAILVQVAKSDRDIGVRRLAIGKIDEADVLAELAAAETERSLRDYAGERAAELWQDTACSSNETSANAALTGIVKLGDQHALVEIAANAALPAIRKRAFGELRDPRALAELAKSDAAQDLRLAAVARIDDGDVLRALAIDTTQKEVGLAAVDKLDDLDRLEHVAQKAKNKAVRQRARKIAGEMADAERAKSKQAVPDEVKRRRAERAQLLREVEAVVETFDFDKHAPAVTAAQRAWSAIAHSDDPGYADADDKFKKATERFWKRKELYAQQARSADELRAVQQEAARERERAAVERAPVPKPDSEEIVRTPDSDPKREAREAEAKARRDERERQRADDDAKRAAQDAEREARRKDDADRGAAIAASLVALCDDLEKLDAASARDGRAIDRALQQAAKAFEQIGKVPGEQRDAISDRYTAARGKLVVRVSELREAEDWARFQNVPKAEALIQTAKAMAAEEPSQDLANRLRQLQALWKDVGAMPQRRSKDLWEQFKQSCDAVYDRVRGLRAAEAEKFGDVTKAKEALIAEAEALAESTDWIATAEKLKALQARWKDSGHLPRKQGDELWKRFRAACDRFFERRKPQLDARHAEEGENLAKKQQLIVRAQKISDGAPGEGGWGKAIGAIKDLQREWKDIGFVPRRDADAVYTAFRAACDSLFAKRDAARDGEANAHRAEVDAIVAEITAIEAGGDDRVNRAIAVRAKTRSLDTRELAGKLEAMLRAVIATESVAGTELDPSAGRARRAKIIAKAEELLPKQPAAAAEAVDIAAQLAQAMRANAFGDLRFSGRDPIEVVDELRVQWADAGPLLDDTDRAQATTFDDLCKRVLGTAAPREDKGERRRRRERHSAEQPIANPAPASAAPIAVAPDVPTAPAQIPFEPLPAPPMPVAPEPPRRVTATLPPMDELDTGWDLDGEDPTAQKTEAPSPPSSDEMASDGATGGDGIDEPGWD
jgi:hypothetical protein